MKFYLIIVILTFVSCHSQTKILDVTNYERISPNEIVGVHYLKSFHTYLEDGFELKKAKRKRDYIYQTMQFTKDGDIVYNDLTKFYDCGNGILMINQGKWTTNEKGNIEITLDGEYAFQSKFQTSSEYSIHKITKKHIKLKLIKITKNVESLAWEE